MARTRGTASFSANYEPQIAAPLDARYNKIDTKADLLLTATWTANDGNVYVYIGMQAYVFNDGIPENRGLYILKAINYDSELSWDKVSNAYVTPGGDTTLAEWDAGELYEGGATVYVSRLGNIYKLILPSAGEGNPPATSWGEDPALFPLVWQLVSTGSLTHVQNTDYRFTDKIFTFTDANIATYYTVGDKTLRLSKIGIGAYNIEGYNVYLFDLTTPIEISYIVILGDKFIRKFVFGTNGFTINNTTGSYGISTIGGAISTYNEDSWFEIVLGNSIDNEIVLDSNGSGSVAMQAIGAYTKHDTGIPVDERKKFKVVAGVLIVAATWTRVGNVITVASTGHGFIDGTGTLEVTISSDATSIPLATYTATKLTDNTFSIVGVNTGAASGTLTYKTLQVKLAFNSPYTSFVYMKEFKIYTVTTSNITSYTSSKAPVKGAWFFYIDSLTASADTPNMVLSQTLWTIINPDVILFNMSVNSTLTGLLGIGKERHTAGRDIFQHARNHAQGAVDGITCVPSIYNGLLTNAQLATDNTNCYGRGQIKLSDSYFFDEDIKNIIINGFDATTLNSTNDAPSLDWDMTVKQYLGFSAALAAGTNTTTLVLGGNQILKVGQVVTVTTSAGVLRGNSIVTVENVAGVNYTVSPAITGMTNTDILVIGSRVPLYALTNVTAGVYTWDRLATGDFLGVSITTSAAFTSANIANQNAAYNNAVSGGYLAVTAGRYYPIYLCKTNHISEPIIAILGQAQSSNTNLTTALAEAGWNFSNILGLGGLDIQEIVPFLRVTMEYNSNASFTTCRLKVRDLLNINFRVSTASQSILNTGGSTSVNHDNTLFGGGNNSSQLKIVGNALPYSVPTYTYHSTGYLWKETYTYRNDIIQTLEKRYEYTGTQLTKTQVADTASGYAVEWSYTYNVDGTIATVTESTIVTPIPQVV